MTWTADTSWLYALFDVDDRHHAAAIKEVQEAEAIEVTPLVLSELIFLAGKRGGRQASQAAVANLERLPHLSFVDGPDLSATLKIWREHAVSFPDANAIAWAHKRRAKLRTFDERQKKVLAKLK